MNFFFVWHVRRESEEERGGRRKNENANDRLKQHIIKHQLKVPQQQLEKVQIATAKKGKTERKKKERKEKPHPLIATQSHSLTCARHVWCCAMMMLKGMSCVLRVFGTSLDLPMIVCSSI
jgi:hypothetical protein